MKLNINIAKQILVAEENINDGFYSSREKKLVMTGLI